MRAHIVFFFCRHRLPPYPASAHLVLPRLRAICSLGSCATGFVVDPSSPASRSASCCSSSRVPWSACSSPRVPRGSRKASVSPSRAASTLRCSCSGCASSPAPSTTSPSRCTRYPVGAHVHGSGIGRVRAGRAARRWRGQRTGGGHPNDERPRLRVAATCSASSPTSSNRLWLRSKRTTMPRSHSAPGRKQTGSPRPHPAMAPLSPRAKGTTVGCTGGLHRSTC